jgi:ferredoxin-NADP reductase
MIEGSDDPAPLARWQNATVVDITPRTPHIKSFTLTPLQPLAFKAGQHVDLRLTAPDGYRAMRSYSIASSPEHDRRIELAIERLENGEVSPFFHDVVAIGAAIELRGPLGGHFVWSRDDGGPLLLIGGGSGVVPLMSMIRYRMSRAATVPVVLLLSARTWDEVLFRDELLALDQSHKGFVLALTLTREAPRRARDYGRRIDAALIAEVLALSPAEPRHVFICGSNAFVNEAADGTVAAGILPGSIKTERYGGNSS